MTVRRTGDDDCLISSEKGVRVGVPSMIWAKVSRAMGKARIIPRIFSNSSSFSTLTLVRSPKPGTSLANEFILIRVDDISLAMMSICGAQKETEVEAGEYEAWRLHSFVSRQAL